MARLPKSWSGGDEMSKFKKIFDVAKERKPETEVQQQNSEDNNKANNKKTTTKTRTAKKSTVKKASLPTEPAPLPPAETPKRGRPKGKRSDPDYEQVTAYIKSKTYTNVKIELLKEGQKRQFSELIQELLDDWVKSRS